jgi:CRP/FNR family transcriptional regulator
VALTDAQAFLIEKEAIAKVVRQNGAFGFNLIKRYSDQNDILYESLDTAIHKQMHGRLATILLYLESFRNETPEIFQLLSRKEIADFAGISTESAVKLLKQFEKDGLINLLEKDILIEKKVELAEISKKG